MDAFVEFLLSPTFASIARNAAIGSILVAIAATAFAVMHYGRGREGRENPSDPWLLVFGTLRDSFILTLLYAAQSLSQQAGGLDGFANAESNMNMVFSSAAMFTGVIFEMAIVVIAALRILALTRWLNGTRP